MKLKDWMKKNKITLKRLANEISYGANYISRVKNGFLPPGRKLANIISDYTKKEVSLDDLGYKEKEKCMCPICGRIMNKNLSKTEGL